MTFSVFLLFLAAASPEAQLRTALEAKTGSVTLPAGTIEISREIVLHHGGEIWLVSVDHGGASFLFTLPLGAERSESSADGLSLQGEDKNDQDGTGL